jgi:ADP-ribose pyrophosphatase YjhB (NUDIX family)
LGFIEHIHVARSAGAPMIRLESADAFAGRGLDGDRYSRREGYWRDGRVSRDLTLVEAEVVESLGLQPGAARRNLTTRHVRLNELVGRYFWIGGELLARGTKLCEPCIHLAELVGRPILQPLVHRGGLRADILTTGRISVGQEMEVVEEQKGVGVVVRRGDGILLGRRLSPHGHGTWSFPGGKPIAAESAEECAVRELFEETGLTGSSPAVIYETVDGFPESHLVFRTSFVSVSVGAGEPSLREPQKMEGWDWYPRHELPSPLFRPVESLIKQAGLS